MCSIKKLLTTCVFVLVAEVSATAQLLDFSVSAYHTTATYRNVRARYAYDNDLIKNPERYHHSGLYIKAYEGSAISLLMSDKRLAVGEYLKIGAGIGAAYSSAFKQIKDDGTLFLYNAGVNGTDAVYSSGPLMKYSFGYQVDLNYGLQARYKLKKNNDDQTIGVRIFYILSLNPAVRPVTRNVFSGTVAAYYTHESFSVLAEADWRMQSNQSNNQFFSITGRKHTDKIKKTYLGLRVEHFRNAAPSLYEGVPGSSMRAYNVYLQLGRMII